MQFKYQTFGYLLGFVVMSSGCSEKGPPLAPVKGVVLLDSAPLADARVTFQPSGPKAVPSFGRTSTDGKFELKFGPHQRGALIGKHQVKISTEKLISDKDGKETQVPEKVPRRYNKESKLELEVAPGENKFDIQLDSKEEPAKSTSKIRGC